MTGDTLTANGIVLPWWLSLIIGLVLIIFIIWICTKDRKDLDENDEISDNCKSDGLEEEDYNIEGDEDGRE